MLLIYKEIQRGAFTKSSVMRKGFLIYEDMLQIFHHIMRRPLVIYDFATAPFWISLYMRKFYFLFYQCNTWMTEISWWCAHQWRDTRLLLQEKEGSCTPEYSQGGEGTLLFTCLCDLHWYKSLLFFLTSRRIFAVPRSENPIVDAKTFCPAFIAY